jgi:hypothetical protein
VLNNKYKSTYLEQSQDKLGTNELKSVFEVILSDTFSPHSFLAGCDAGSGIKFIHLGQYFEIYELYLLVRLVFLTSNV